MGREIPGWALVPLLLELWIGDTRVGSMTGRFRLLNLSVEDPKFLSIAERGADVWNPKWVPFVADSWGLDPLLVKLGLVPGGTKNWGSTSTSHFCNMAKIWLINTITVQLVDTYCSSFASSCRGSSHGIDRHFVRYDRRCSHLLRFVSNCFESFSAVLRGHLGHDLNG